MADADVIGARHPTSFTIDARWTDELEVDHRQIIGKEVVPLIGALINMYFFLTSSIRRRSPARFGRYQGQPGSGVFSMDVRQREQKPRGLSRSPSPLSSSLSSWSSDRSKPMEVSSDDDTRYGISHVGM